MNLMYMEYQKQFKYSATNVIHCLKTYKMI